MARPKLSDSKKHSIFRALASKSLLEVGFEFGLDKYLDNKTKIRNEIYKIYQEVRTNPEKYGISEEVLELVEQGIDARKHQNDPTKYSSGKEVATEDDLSSKELIEQGDTKAIVIGGRNKAGKLLHKKMDILMKSPKQLKAENMGTLAKVFGILFDKAQIIQGQATENIAVRAKIGDDISPEDAMDMIIKGRERIMSEKYD